MEGYTYDPATGQWVPAQPQNKGSPQGPSQSAPIDPFTGNPMYVEPGRHEYVQSEVDKQKAAAKKRTTNLQNIQKWAEKPAFANYGQVPQVDLSRQHGAFNQLNNLRQNYSQGPMAQALARQQALSQAGAQNAAGAMGPMGQAQLLRFGGGGGVNPLAQHMGNQFQAQQALTSGQNQAALGVLQGNQGFTQDQNNNIGRLHAARGQAMGSAIGQQKNLLQSLAGKELAQNY